MSSCVEGGRDGGRRYLTSVLLVPVAVVKYHCTITIYKHLQKSE